MTWNRTESVHRIEREEADLLVIGGGITGGGILLDAQSRGMRTYLIDMQDFAAGTSSRSTKLIHGGLRYLKNLQFGIVAQTGKERAIVYENSRHITRPEWMMLPIFKGGTYGKWTSSLGILTYDLLAGVKKSERRQILSKEETMKREPLLRSDGLRGSGYYVEYRTDDARLTIEVIKKAVEFGAIATNYVKALDFIYENGVIKGVQAVDLITKKQISIFAKKIVNATGPWVDELRERDGSKKGKYLHWTKGVHIVLDRKKIPLQQSIYFDVPDGRMVFAIPRGKKVYVGTTDTNYMGDLMYPKATLEDKKYLLNALDIMFPSIKTNIKDIESSWAGIRPLIHEEGKSPSEISRKDEIFYSPTGLITIAGGKLTGYRKMAEKVVDYISNELSKNGKWFRKCYTDRIALSGGNIQDIDYFMDENIKRGMEIDLSKEEASILTQQYGSNVSCVYDLIEKGYKEIEQYKMSKKIYGSLLYGLKHEMVVHPVDFFIRRTGDVWFNIQAVYTWKDICITYMKMYFGWSQQKVNAYTEDLNLALKSAVENKL